MNSADRLEELRAEARHARQRYDLYRARMYGMRPTTMSQLRELERTNESAGARLRAAEREAAAPPEPRNGAIGRTDRDGRA